MSINIIYNRLFNLSIFHDYYEDGLANDYRLVPTFETTEFLKGGRMLFKTIPKGCTVLYRTLADESGAFINKGPDARLLFSLSMNNNSKFLNITDLDESTTKKYSSGHIIYLSNTPASPSSDAESPEELNYQLLDFLEGRLFSYQFKLNPALASPGDVLFTVSDENNNPVPVGKKFNGDPFDDTLTLTRSEDGSYTQLIDLRDYPKGRYTITVKNPASPLDPPLKVVHFYSDELLLGKKVLAIVDIELNQATNPLYTSTWEYAIRFSRKSSVWKYFIVDKTEKVADLDNYDLSITDERTDGNLPYAANYTFTRDGQEPHATIRINGKNTVIFKSDALIPIPFFETPLPGIQLKKVPNDTGDSEQLIIQNLPNPSHKGVIKEEAGILESEIYVFI